MALDVRDSNLGGAKILFSSFIKADCGAHPAPCIMGTAAVSWGKSGGTLPLNTHPI